MVESTSLPDDPSRPLRDLIAAGRFREALEAHRQTQDPAIRQRPEVQLLAATAATRLGEFSLGVSLAEGALERFRARADNDGRMRASNLLGVLAFEHGNLADAERSLGEALALAHDLDDTMMAARASNNLASVAQLRGTPDLALSMYRSALLSYQRLGDRRGTAEAYHNLGLVFRHLGEWRDAEESANQSVRNAELIADPSLQALALTGRAEVHLARGELEVARQALVRAARLATEAEDEIGGAEVGRIMALLSLREGNLSAAVEAAEGARAVAVRHQSALLQGECAAAAALALRRLGRPEEAEVRRQEAMRLFEKLGALTFKDDLEAQWSALS